MYEICVLYASQNTLDKYSLFSHKSKTVEKLDEAVSYIRLVGHWKLDKL